MNRNRSGRALEIRGLMLDPARLTERHEFYFDLLPQLAKWGFNTLWWHFVDDEGFVLKLDSHPELATPYAFSKAETRRLVRAAGEVGIDVVPEVESLGHASYITRLPQYAYLRDGDPHHFNAVCPSHPDTIKLLGEIIEETAELFDSPYFHAGLDEVDLSGCPRCRRRIAARGQWRLFADHVGAIHEIVAGCGKRMIMWADHVERAPAMLKAIAKDIVLCHWHYSRVNAGKEFERSLAAGFDIIGAPSMLRYGNVIGPHASQMDNTEQMVTAARRLTRRGMLGVVNTLWTPRRILRDDALAAVAYTGSLLAGGEANRAGFFAKYLRGQFGLAGKAVAGALHTLHERMLLRAEFQALAFDSLVDVFAAVAMYHGEGFRDRAEQLSRAADVLAAAAGKVKRHGEEFNAYVLAGRVAVALLAGAEDLAEAVEIYRQAENLKDRGYEPPAVAEKLDQAVARLADIRSRVDELCRLVWAEWDRTRHSGDVKKDVRRIADPCPVDSLTGRLARSGAFAKSLHGSFAGAVKKYRRAGPFPTGI